MMTEHKTRRITAIFAIRDLLKSAPNKNASDIWANAHNSKVTNITIGAVLVNRLRLNLAPDPAKTAKEIAERTKKVTKYEIN